jgi:endonuclease-3
MGSASRTSQFAHVFKVVKKHYKPIASYPDRPVLEHLLLGCCLEDSHYEPAEEAFAAVVHTFFDFNEVRVTTIAELAEVVSGLPDPRAAANRVKRVLQAVFEQSYSFDLEELRKKNLGPTIKWLHEIDGTTNFSVSYVVQAALGGHAIPIDRGVLDAFLIAGLVSERDVAEGVVPGLERAIAKSKGIEFGSLIHQLGADFTANPFSPAVRKVLLDIDPACKDRLPKRSSRKDAGEEDAAAAAETAEAPAAVAPSATDAPAGTPAAEDDQPTRSRKRKTASAADKEAPSTDKASTDKASTDKASTDKTSGDKPQKSKKSTSAKSKTASEDAPKRSKAGKKSASAGLAKRKPR